MTFWWTVLAVAATSFVVLNHIGFRRAWRWLRCVVLSIKCVVDGHDRYAVFEPEVHWRCRLCEREWPCG